MRADLVLDASVAAKFFFNEDGSDRAEALLTSGVVVAAPDLLFLEMASIAATRVRRGLDSETTARDAVNAVVDLVDEVEPSRGLRVLAYIFARDDGFSAYDGSYLALAERLGVPVVTADDRLVARARSVGVARLVRRL
jgi:predicted nucleic acid-binding protein